MEVAQGEAWWVRFCTSFYLKNLYRILDLVNRKSHGVGLKSLTTKRKKKGEEWCICMVWLLSSVLWHRIHSDHDTCLKIDMCHDCKKSSVLEARLSKSRSYVRSLKVGGIIDCRIRSWIVRSYIFSDLKQKTHW